MKIELFLNFDGNCREAADFYADVFNSSVNNLMTYDEAPPDPNHPRSEADRDRVMYAGIPAGDMVIMVMDVPSGVPWSSGNQISPTISADDTEEVRRLFNSLAAGGTVMQPLQQVFFSDLYGMVLDKYGIVWQVLHYAEEA